MTGLPEILATAVVLFAGTNLDDMIVLAVLSASSRAGGRPRRWQIWTGQYIGVAVLTGLSLAAAGGLTILPNDWVWLLGFLPIALGLGKLASAILAHAKGLPAPKLAAGGLPGVIGLTISNGGDNLAAYTPMFRTLTIAEILWTIATFAVLIAVWCATAERLVFHQRVTALVVRYGHWIIPAVYIAIGFYVFHKAGALG